MSAFLVATYVLLWMLVGFLSIAVLALARQIGLLQRRLPPVGARMEPDGPAVGVSVPDLDAVDVLGRRVTLGSSRGRHTLLIFVSPACTVCGELMPAVRSVWSSDSRDVEIILVSLNDDERANREYIRVHGLSDIPYVSSKTLGHSYEVSGLPYAVLLGPDRVVQTKGLANHLEHLESLLNAPVLGQPSIDSYMRANPASDRQTVAPDGSDASPALHKQAV